MEDAAANFLHYQQRIVERREAYQRYNYASVALELARVRERAAEVESQHEPFATIGRNIGAFEPRQLGCALVHYVMCGRLPTWLADGK